MGEHQQDPIDRFTAAHVGIGAALGAVGVPLIWVTVIGLLWELSEDGLKEAAPEVFPEARPDTKANALVDGIAFAVGGAVGQKLFKPRPLW